MQRKISGWIVVLSLVALIPSLAAADACVPASGKQDAYSAALARKGEKRLKKARAILSNLENNAEKMMGADDSDDSNDSGQQKSGKLAKLKMADVMIPALLLSQAKCVVIIPGEKAIGFAGYGVDFGAGVSMCRDNGDDDFSNAAPRFVKIRGGAYGPQIGGKSTDRVLLFMNSNASEILKKPSLKLGADVAVAAGPLGRDIEAETNLHAQDGVLSYSHSKGVYAGATLDGAVLEPDTKMNEAVAGEKVKRGFFGRIGHGLGGIFHHAKDGCEAEIAAAGAASEVNTAVNPPADAPAGVATSDSEGQKPGSDLANPARSQPPQASSTAGNPDSTGS